MELNELLEASGHFDEQLVSMLDDGGFALSEGPPRIRTCAGAILLSLEHARMVRVAFGKASPNSGTALLRLQYEALLKGAWVLHAANELQVAKLASSLTPEAEQAAKNLPGAAEMLSALLAKAPPGLTAPLQEFQGSSLKARNSFGHGGIHPLSRLADGFPQALAGQVVKMSNGLLHMSYRMLASLSGSNSLMATITHAYRDHQACLPIIDR